jgi:hypothetical protein
MAALDSDSTEQTTSRLRHFARLTRHAPDSNGRGTARTTRLRDTLTPGTQPWRAYFQQSPPKHDMAHFTVAQTPHQLPSSSLLSTLRAKLGDVAALVAIVAATSVATCSTLLI